MEWLCADHPVIMYSTPDETAKRTKSTAGLNVKWVSLERDLVALPLGGFVIYITCL